MSGKPYPAGVEELSKQLRLLTAAQEDVARTEHVISEHQEKLKVAREQEKAALEDIKALMAEMDVHAPGNFGYEGRMLWVLKELNRQAENYGRGHL
jgi:hypothetical protein